MASRPARTVLDIDRAARLLLRFLEDHRLSLAGPDLALTPVDVSLEDAVDALCQRLATDPDHDLLGEPRPLRVLLAARVLLALINSRIQRAAFPSFAVLGPIDDTAAQAYLLGQLIGTMRVPASQNGILFSSLLATVVH